MWLFRAENIFDSCNNNHDHTIASVHAFAGAAASIAACFTSVSVVSIGALSGGPGMDSRSFRKPPSQLASDRLSSWQNVKNNPAYSESWYRSLFRINRTSFRKVLCVVVT